MFNGLMFPHQFIDGVGVPTSHYEVNHSWALPPLVVVIVAEELRRYWQGERFSCSGSLQANNFPDAVS